MEDQQVVVALDCGHAFVVLILGYLIQLLWRKLKMGLVLGRLELAQKQMSA